MPRGTIEFLESVNPNSNKLFLVKKKSKGARSKPKTQEMDKTIRATITVEVPYKNEYMNYGDKLNKKLKQIIADADFVPCSVQAGNLEPSTEPVIKETK